MTYGVVVVASVVVVTGSAVVVIVGVGSGVVVATSVVVGRGDESEPHVPVPGRPFCPCGAAGREALVRSG